MLKLSHYLIHLINVIFCISFHGLEFTDKSFRLNHLISEVGEVQGLKCVRTFVSCSKLYLFLSSLLRLQSPSIIQSSLRLLFKSPSSPFSLPFIHPFIHFSSSFRCFKEFTLLSTLIPPFFSLLSHLLHYPHHLPLSSSSPTSSIVSDEWKRNDHLHSSQNGG